MVTTSDSQLREPGFESSCCRFEAFTILFITHCLSSLGCINEYLATDRGIYVNDSLCAVIAAWLNGSQKSRDYVGLPVGEV